MLADPNPTTRTYPLPEHGALVLDVPANWSDGVRQPSNLPPTITFRPAAGDDFQVLITALWSARSEAGFNAPARLRASVESHGRGALAQAVERDLVIEELWGDLALTFTVLYRRPDEPARAAALEMLRKARQAARP